MAKYHVRSDGSMGVCKAKDGGCPFGSEEGTRHFTSERETRKYSENVIKSNMSKSGGMGMMRKSASSNVDRKWIGKSLNNVITEKSMEPYDADAYPVADVMRVMSHGLEGDWEDGDASTPAESRDLENMSRFAVALEHDFDGVREQALRYHGDERDNIVERLEGVMYNADDDTADKAERLMDELAS